MKKGLLAVIITFGVLSFGINLYHRGLEKINYKKKLETASVFSQPRNIAKFKLTDNNGEQFDNHNLKGHYRN